MTPVLCSGMRRFGLGRGTQLLVAVLLGAAIGSAAFDHQVRQERQRKTERRAKFLRDCEERRVLRPALAVKFIVVAPRDDRNRGRAFVSREHVEVIVSGPPRELGPVLTP